MITFSLNGEWQLFHFREGEHVLSNPQALLESGLASIPAQVPGNVELDLQRAGLLPDPFLAANIRQLRSLEDHEWWYRRTVIVPDEFARQPSELVFEGLDTLATVWVNGQQVGQAANMLVEHRFDVTHALRPGRPNTIVVRLRSALNEARRHTYDAVMTSWEHRMEGLFIRKAPHVWGWDIMPRAVSAGIWRPVRLQTIPANAIEQIYYWTVKADLREATLGVRFQVRTASQTTDGLTMRFRGVCGDQTFEHEWPLEFIADECLIPVTDARLWWPAGYGEPYLYTVTAQLCPAGRVLAERTDRVGLRKLEVDRTELAGPAWSLEPADHTPSRIDRPPSPESHFVISVNDEPIMIKGANWVPLDAFHSRDADRLEAALGMVADLGCNMLRCWGGNVYESDAFFDWCDAHGVLVWQDFAFACCIYPQTEGFLAEVRREAEAVARRLRNHPALAVWCGDNEVDQVYLSQGNNPEHNRLTREVLPQVLQRCDPFRAYLPSSPHVTPAAFNHPDAWNATPEQHLWGPRGYFKSPFYARHSAHFIGEIGYHGCPNVSSIEKFISPEHLWPWPANDEWQVHSVYHWRHAAIQRDRIQLMANQIRELFGVIPDDLPTFALASQITQAEAKKFFIESTRQRKWQTSGILWWNLLDGWPQFSDAVVDYYFAPKLAYHYIWRVQRPVCVFVGEAGSGSGLPVVASNDTRQAAAVEYRIWDAATGKVSSEGHCNLPPNQNWQVARISTGGGKQRLWLIEWEVDGASFGNHYLAGVPPFSLEQYLDWLPFIAKLHRSFPVEAVAR